MPGKVRIALDAMGGDRGATVVIPGAEQSLSRHPDVEFVIFGDRAVLTPLLAAKPALSAASRVVHKDVAGKMDAKPSQALREGRWKSMMWLVPPHGRRGQDGRQAKPGAAERPLEKLDVACHRRGEARRSRRRRFRRQHRRA